MSVNGDAKNVILAAVWLQLSAPDQVAQDFVVPHPGAVLPAVKTNARVKQRFFTDDEIAFQEKRVLAVELLAGVWGYPSLEWPNRVAASRFDSRLLSHPLRTRQAVGWLRTGAASVSYRSSSVGSLPALLRSAFPLLRRRWSQRFTARTGHVRTTIVDTEKAANIPSAVVKRESPPPGPI